MTLIAYHGKATNKTKILKQLKAHAKADEIVKGVYWEGGKGCAVGCTVHSGNHAEYEPRFGIPIMLATLEDRIFEGLPNAKAKEWPIAFMSAIRPGADLSLVGWQFLHWLLTDEKVNPGINHPLVKNAVKQCAEVLLPLTRGEPIDQESASRAAYSANRAYSAEYSAEYSAYSAACAANSAACAANSAACAASAAYSAASAAASAESAANSAAYAANSAYSAYSAAAYSRMAKKLLSLLKAAPKGSKQ